MNEDELKITKEELQRLKNQLHGRVDDLVDRISVVYKIMNWEWTGGVPSRVDLKNEAHRLIDNLTPGKEFSFRACGGLRAEYWGYYENDESIHWEGRIKMDIDEFSIVTRRKIKNE